MNEIEIRGKITNKEYKTLHKFLSVNAILTDEYEIDLKEGELVDALRLFEALGFKTGMIYFWKSSIYKYKDFEIKINKYPNGYRDWEIESQNPKSDPNELAEELNLKSFTGEEFEDEISWKNNNLHELYSLEKVKELLESMFNKLSTTCP